MLDVADGRLQRALLQPAGPNASAIQAALACFVFSPFHIIINFYIIAARCYVSAACFMRCPSVCEFLSVTFVDCVETNKHIFKFFSTVGVTPF